MSDEDCDCTKVEDVDINLGLTLRCVFCMRYRIKVVKWQTSNKII